MKVEEIAPNSDHLFRSSSYIALRVKNRSQAVKFYAEVLGMEALPNQDDPHCEVILKHGPVSLVIDECKPQADGAGRVCFEFFTPNLDRAILAVKAAGCTLEEPTEGGDFRGHMISDPYGMKFHLYQKKEK